MAGKHLGTASLKLQLHAFDVCASQIGPHGATSLRFAPGSLLVRVKNLRRLSGVICSKYPSGIAFSEELVVARSRQHEVQKLPEAYAPFSANPGTHRDCGRVAGCRLPDRRKP